MILIRRRSCLNGVPHMIVEWTGQRGRYRGPSGTAGCMKKEAAARQPLVMMSVPGQDPHDMADLSRWPRRMVYHADHQGIGRNTDFFPFDIFNAFHRFVKKK